MDNNKKWFEFMKSAHTLLLNGQTIDHYQSHIQILVEPSFDNSFHLQLEVNEQVVKWHRTTWLRLVDAPKFYDPIESLKHIGQAVGPTIIYESGTTEIISISPIFDFVKLISTKPKIEKWGGIMLDGVFYTLKIGVENTQTTFKWHHLPDEWKDIEKLANMLTELNSRL
ncbi:MAG: hypothetical protein IPP64_16170 [Bacteroidetes bacterium]|nr:hypothetical protein [Bacteroidota bacterium]